MLWYHARLLNLSPYNHLFDFENLLRSVIIHLPWATMGVLSNLRKKDGSDAASDAPAYDDNLANKDEECGHQQAIKTGWTGDGHAGASEYPSAENYQTLGRWRACVILITIEVGIGVLSLPSALQTLGLIPGIIAIFGFGGLTTYCGYIMVQFYRRYPMASLPSTAHVLLFCGKKEDKESCTCAK